MFDIDTLKDAHENDHLVSIEPGSVSKSYKDISFILTEQKLSRVVEVAKDRIASIKGGGNPKTVYTVDLLDGKELIIDNIDSVLKLDNSKTNPITKIDISILSKNDNGLENRIEIRFSSGGHFYGFIYISVSSPNPVWSKDTMIAVEEQAERTILKNFIYTLIKKKDLLVMAFLIFLMVFTIIFADFESGYLKIPENVAVELNIFSKSVKTETEKIDFIFRYLSATLEKSAGINESRTSAVNQFYFIGLPIFIGVVTSFITIFFFYPKNIFSWGDKGELYKQTVARRKFLWSGVILALIIGILSNMFVVGVVSFGVS